MKKHRVDDLFKHKLTGLELQPSSSAWSKIANEAKSKQATPGWGWYAAASIIVALLAGYAVWENKNTDPTQIRVASKLESVSKNQPPVAGLIEKDSELNGKVDDQIQTVIVSETIATRKRRKVVGIIQKSDADDKKIVDSQKELIGADLKEIHSVVIDDKSEEVNPLGLKALTSISVERKSSEMQTEIEPLRTVMVVVDSDDLVSELRPKASRLSKVFRQLKNARAGERVDWEEVGFDPKGLVARVDGRLRNGGEKVSEQYHNIKEKTKL